MSTLSASLTLRPTRIGFLVRPDDLESLRRIFQVCTCLWGGIYNPIIPVWSELPEAWREQYLAAPSPSQVANGYIRFFEPDVFVESQSGLAQELGLPEEQISFSQSRVIPLETFFSREERYEDEPPFGTSVFHLYKDLYERQFQFLPRDERHVGMMATDTPHAAFVECFSGGFPSAGPLSQLAQSYVDAFAPLVLPAAGDSWFTMIRDRFLSPLQVTREQLNVSNIGGRSEPTLFIADPNSGSDLIDLWNLKLFRRGVLPVNLLWLKENSDFLGEFLKANCRPLPRNPNGLMIYPTIQIGRSIQEDRARAAIEEARILPEGLEGSSYQLKLWYDGIWREQDHHFATRPRRLHIAAETARLELTTSDEDKSVRVQFKSLSPEFAEAYGGGDARWVNVLNIENYGRDDTLALALPLSLDGGMPLSMRVGEATIVSREGFVLPQRFTEHGEYFRLFKGRDAIVQWLKPQGIHAEPADPGRITDQIISSTGGIWGTRLLADRETLVLLDKMSKSTTTDRNGTIEEFPERSVEARQWKQLLGRRTNNPHTRHLSIDHFIKANILRLGLMITCKNCFKKNWYSVDSLDFTLTCERCLKDFPFPQASLPFESMPWHYRVVGPFSVPDFAAGAYATALALSALSRDLILDRPNITYATNLHYKFGEESAFEVDFTLWFQRRRALSLLEEPALVFGEAKSFAVEGFQVKDVERMRKLSARFPGAFMVFATLKDALSDTEKSLITDFAQWGRTRLEDGRTQAPVIVLTGIELFAHWNIKEAWKEAGDRYKKFTNLVYPEISDLAQLALMTQELYLGMPASDFSPESV